MNLPNLGLKIVSSKARKVGGWGYRGGNGGRGKEKRQGGGFSLTTDTPQTDTKTLRHRDTQTQRHRDTQKHKHRHKEKQQGGGFSLLLRSDLHITDWHKDTDTETNRYKDITEGKKKQQRGIFFFNLDN